MKTGKALKGKKVLLGVTGGIAAYKTVYLLRLLKAQGADVEVIMTEAACEFVAPLTFETLSEKKVHIHMFEKAGEGGTPSPVEHIALSRWPDVVVIAPATANTVAKLSYGRTDDLLSAVVSAFTGMVVLAPAMNHKMWENQTVKENLAKLSTRGFRVVPPGEGELACGTDGAGRMAEPEKILEFLANIYGGSCSGIKVLVSAGRTEEDIDPVRFISNRSSGKMGFALAEAARDLGADVTVVAGMVSIRPPEGVRLICVRSASEMSRELKAALVNADMLIMAAAVSDYTVKSPLKQKQKEESWTLSLMRSEDILMSLGKMKGKRFIIGFALETEDVEANAREKLSRKGCDLIVANNPSQAGAGFGGDTNAVTIYNRQRQVLSTGVRSKREIAEIILQAACEEEAFKRLRI